MASESDRIARAGDYMFGLMNDRERERAERDLQIDPSSAMRWCGWLNGCMSSIAPDRRTARSIAAGS